MKLKSKIALNEPANEVASNAISVQPAQPPTAQQYEQFMAEFHTQAELQRLDAMSAHYAVAAYGAIYTKVSQRLKTIIKAVDNMRSFYLVDVILSQIAEDALAPKAGGDELVKFSHPDEKIQEELDDLHKRIGLDQLIENIAPDILAYGEYTLATVIDAPPEPQTDQLNNDPSARRKRYKPKKAAKGVVDVTDIVDQGTVISLTQDGKVEGYLVLDELQGKVAIKETADYVKFSLGGQRVRVDVKGQLPNNYQMNPVLKEAMRKIPRFIRIGKSELFAVLEKLKELELLEKLIPASKINKLSQGNLVGMNLPESFDLEAAQKAVKKVEGMINRKVNVDPQSGEITVESILSTAGKTKIMPLFGDKGSLQNMDYKQEEADSLMSDTKEIREIILDSVGVPSELIFKSDGDSKADILKRYAKYVRKLKRLQKAISEGAKQIAYIHLANRGIAFKKEEVEVIFNNTLIEIDNLDTLEHADVTLGLLGNVRDFFNEMADDESAFRDNVRLDKVLEFIESNLKTIGLADAVELAKEGGGDPDKEADSIGDTAKDGNDPKDEPTEDPAPEGDGDDLEKGEGDE